VISSGSSSVAIEMRLPMSSMTSMACWFQEPAVSTAIGVMIWVLVGSHEFAALLATNPAWAEVSVRPSASPSHALTSQKNG